MALRILTYSGLLYQELVRSRAPAVAGERLPAVLYNRAVDRSSGDGRPHHAGGAVAGAVSAGPALLPA